jgi:hypothetical protein
MKNNIVKISESALRQIIAESVKIALKEMDEDSTSWGVDGREMVDDSMVDYIDYDLLHGLSYPEAYDACINIVMNNPEDVIIVWPFNNETREKGEIFKTEAAIELGL